MSQVFGIYNAELEVNIKYKILTLEQCENFAERYSDLPKNEYIGNVLNACIFNISSEVKPALAKLDMNQASHTMVALYNGSIMLNPVLDPATWSEISFSYNLFNKKNIDAGDSEPDFYDQEVESDESARPKPKPFIIPKAKFNAMPRVLKQQIIGQDEPIDLVHNALKRHQAGLTDPNRPIGVFLFCGPSGVGKTLIAEKLHEYLFNGKFELISVDCGEYQHKHENQKLLGSPAGYTGHDEGGFLYKQMKSRSATVFLIDEVEKAHPDLFHTFLRAFSKGLITDAKGNDIDFRNTIFILTSNLGNDKISEEAYGRKPGFTSIDDGGYNTKTAPNRKMVERTTMEAIHKYFKPELLNRLDEIVIFNYLTQQDYRCIADLEFKNIARKLLNKNYNLTWSAEASDLLVSQSSLAMGGARSMEKIRRSNIEDMLASLLLTKNFPKGKTFEIKAANNQFVIK